LAIDFSVLGKRKIQSPLTFAIEGLTQSLAKELPQGITVVSVDPGNGINTDMLQQIYPESAAEYPSPDAWAKKAVPFLMRISNKDNGKSLIVPD
jgi:NAD(P)-dependent dehydrogenase (short-subunit alcohol dehydrogenase family)